MHFLRHAKPIRAQPAGKPLRALNYSLIILVLLLCGPINLSAQGNAELQADFQAALKGLPSGPALEGLPSDQRAQVASTRALYTEGARMEGMSNAEVLQLSVKLKANTARAQQLLAALAHADCIQSCLYKRATCKDNCPGPKGLACKCCLRCNLQLDICATNCLLRQSAPAKPRPPSPGKKVRSRN